MAIRDVKKALGYLAKAAGLEKVAKRFRVSLQTIRRWLRAGPPKERWKAVLATAQRYQDSEWREREKREWSLEVLNQ